jgi:hypothetical protein
VVHHFVSLSVPEIIDPVFAKQAQNARFHIIENERFGLVFMKTRVYKFGHWILPASVPVCGGGRREIAHYIFTVYTVLYVRLWARHIIKELAGVHKKFVYIKRRNK